MNLLNRITSELPWKKQSREVKNAVTKITQQLKREHSLFRKEIREWKVARAAALDNDMPRRTLLIHLYEDIMSDAFIWGKFQNRILRISNKEISVIDANGEVDEDKTKLLKKKWFNKFVKLAMESKAYGYSLMYPSKIDDNGFIENIELVYRTHIVPETCEILRETGDQRGVKFNEGQYKDWCIYIGESQFLGLLDKAAPLWIFKKHSWQNWDEFEEMFGIPMRIAKVASQDKQVQSQITKYLKDLGSAAYGIFPEGTEIEITESKSRDAFNVFNEKRKAANEELAILIDGNFETSAETGSRAKAGEVIENTQKEITKDDELTTLFEINELLLPFLINRGYPFSEDDTIIWNDNTKLTPKERLDIFKGVKDLGYTVKKEQVETELDVELEEQADPEPPEPENRYLQNFKQPHNHDGCGAHSETYRLIDFELLNQLSDHEEDLLRKLWDQKESINWDYEEFTVTHCKLLDALQGGYGEVDFDFESTDHIAMEYLQSNIHRFGVDKTQKEIYDLNQILKDTDNYSDFRKRALKVFPNYKENWLQTEYNQAQSAAQAAARYKRYMDNADIAPYWQYKTVEDERVRRSHRPLHDKVFRKDDVSSWQFLPPNGWNCRCDDIELIDYDGEVSSLKDAIGADPDGYELMKKSGHAVNWGNAKEVFTASQGYLKDLSIDAIDTKTLDYKKQGLQPFKQSLKAGIIGSGKFDFNKHTDRSDEARFTDAMDQPVWLNKELSDQIENKHRLAEVVSNPDELYYSKIDNVIIKEYFKHYEDGSLYAKAVIGLKSKADLVDFLKLDNPDSLRNGLLIYTPAEHIKRRKASYNEFGSDYTKDHFNETNGGYLVIHKNHGVNEVKANTEIGRNLSKIAGKAVVLVDNPNTKTSFDALVNGVEWEFKTLEKYSNLKSRVQKEIRKGSTQSGNILLFIKRNYNIEDLSNGVYAAYKHDFDKRIRFISILFPNGKLIKFSRKQIETGEFNKLLK